MTLGRVIGTATTTRYEGGVAGGRLLLVAEAAVDGHASSSAPILALDAVQAGPGDLVLLSQGSSTRNLLHTADRAVDALVVGIIDLIEHEGSLAYSRAAEETQPNG